ncbi:MAG: rod shape-determining protein MreC [Oscillospiraceae bacterium]|jgi:rod shape-determining protein MreC|nr:rod shape-determining protein MreC [Oscillospiraceae bacterium]
MLVFFRSVKFKIVLGMAVLMAVLMVLSVSGADAAAGTKGVLGAVSGPVRSFSNSIGSFFDTNFRKYFQAGEYYEENQALKAEIADLYERLNDYEDTKKELDELRKFIGIKIENEEYKLSPPAKVTGFIANDPFSSFMIDKGAKSDIKLYDPVVTGDGLVGIVAELYDSYCVVKTILSPEVSMGGLCVESEDNGVIEGNISSAVSGHCRMVFIDSQNSVRPGNLIVTSGNSGRFPREYSVGTVVDIVPDARGLSSYATVKPFADIQNIKSVMVIIGS